MLTSCCFTISVSLVLSLSNAARCSLVQLGAAQSNAAATPGVAKPLVATGVCTASGGCDEYISRVQMGAIDETSACGQYEDRSGQAIVVSPGQALALTVTNGNPIYADDYCAVWADWNQDNVWDTTERLGLVSGTGPYEFVITVPGSAPAGRARLRIRIAWNDLDPQPCGATSFGEVEDYALLVATAPLYGSCCELSSGICIDETASSECQSVGQQFHADALCSSLAPACGNPGACCSDILEVCQESVAEFGCVGTRFAPGATCAELEPICGEQPFSFAFDPDTGPPPEMTCGLTMLPLPADPRPLFDFVSSISTPCPDASAISFSIPLSHRRIGAGWEWWSHGYTGDVYYSDGSSEVTLTLPAHACALYFYIQPNVYAPETFRFTINGATQSEPIAVDGAAAAYVGVCGAGLQTVRVVCTDGSDFGIGEFAIACYCGTELCACCNEDTQQCQDSVSIVTCLQDLDARVLVSGLCAHFDPACGSVQGACCEGDACQLRRPADCAGEYLGDGSVCTPNPCTCADLVITAPGSWTGSTCGLHNYCEFSSTPELFCELQIPHLGLWRIDACTSSFQVLLEFGETCCDTFGYEQGACDLEPYLDHLLSPGSYFITVEGWTTCGTYNLQVYELAWGACCNNETAQCVDFVLTADCHGAHAEHVLCADLDPPCTGPGGACCTDPDAVCTETDLAHCTGRFAPATTCATLSPLCGLWRPCTHRIDLYDGYGDGWSANLLDVYVDDAPVLVNLSLTDGSGPVSYEFQAGAGDQIRTVYHAYGSWPEEPYYQIVSGRGALLIQDGDGSRAPTGVVIAADCPEPCGDLDLDYDVDFYDYGLLLDSLSQCWMMRGYMGRADLDLDGCITLADLELWMACYFQYGE